MNAGIEVVREFCFHAGVHDLAHNILADLEGKNLRRVRTARATHAAERIVARDDAAKQPRQRRPVNS